LTTEEARAVARESNINTDRWFGQTMDGKNFVLGISFKRTSWVGPVITNSALVANIHHGGVTDVRTEQTVCAPWSAHGATLGQGGILVTASRADRSGHDRCRPRVHLRDHAPCQRRLRICAVVT
jgi:hypothetical protein